MLRAHRLHLTRSRRGNALAVTGVCLIPIMGVMAIVVDGGLLMAERRHAQAVADSSALAAAYSLYTNYGQNGGLDPSGSAKKEALSIAADNGYANDGTTSTVTVNIPPLTGSFIGESGYAEINVQYNQQRYFSALWGTGTMSITARAVARGIYSTGSSAILLLGKSGTTVSAVGNGTIKITDVNTGNGGSVYIDSTGPTAVSMKGNANMSAPSIFIAQTGSVPSGVTATGGGSVVMGATPAADPLSSLPAPSIASPPAGTNVVSLPGGINGSMTLQSNTIYIVGGNGISLSGNSTVTGTNVMIYLTGANASVDLSGNGAVTLSPMTSGIYKGITVFQDRSDTNGGTFVGNGNLNVTGTIYTPSASITAKGNGTTDIFGSQIIANSLRLTGNGTVNVDFSPVRETRLVE